MLIEKSVKTSIDRITCTRKDGKHDCDKKQWSLWFSNATRDFSLKDHLKKKKKKKKKKKDLFGNCLCGLTLGFIDFNSKFMRVGPRVAAITYLVF